MTERIKCLTVSCRRTAPPGDGDSEIICGKCWRLLPKELRGRYKSLRARQRRLERKIDRRVANGTISADRISAIADTLERQIDTNWHAIRTYVLNPPSPAGLENFMNEMGFAEEV